MLKLEAEFAPPKERSANDLLAELLVVRYRQLFISATGIVLIFSSILISGLWVTNVLDSVCPEAGNTTEYLSASLPGSYL